MFSVGLSEIALVLIVAVLALKPEQMMQAVRTYRKLRADWNAWRTHLNAEQLRAEKERALAERIALAASVSDVSDLLPKEKHDE